MSERMVPRVCPVCGYDQRHALWRKGDLTAVRCARCAMVYAHPVLKSFESGEFYQARGEAYYLTAEKLRSDYSPVRFERELRWFKHWCDRGEVLDVGCNTGGFLCHLKHSGPYRVTGMDVSLPALEHAARQGISVIRGSFLEHDFGLRRFAAVTFWAVLEHLIDPAVFLRKAADILGSNGYCFVLVPNIQSLAVRLLGARYRYLMPQHLNYFSRDTLAELVERVGGFKIVRMGSCHFNPIVILQDLRRPRTEVPELDRASLLHRTTSWKEQGWLRPLKSLYGLTEKALGTLDLADNLIAVLQKKTGAGSG